MPIWWESDESKIYERSASGSSPFNEWYEFDDRSDALDLIGKTFKSQSFCDGFTWFEGELYAYDQFTPESMSDADSPDEYELIPGAEAANLGSIIEAESPF